MKLVAQMVGQISAFDRRRLIILPLFELGFSTGIVESIENELFPVGFVFALRRVRFLLFLLFVRGAFFFLLGLLQFEERVAEEFTLEVLLQIEHGHVKQIHRLVEARIHP